MVRKEGLHDDSWNSRARERASKPKARTHRSSMLTAGRATIRRHAPIRLSESADGR
jgi:hypothetical protein